MTLNGLNDRFMNHGRKALEPLIRLSRRIILPGFDGIPLYDVTLFFIRGLSRGYLTSRAAAISFSAFLAIIPFMIFLFTIIPFIPISNFQQSLLSILQQFMPHTAWNTVEETLVDIITRPRSGLLFLNFFLALYFSTNGVNSLIEAFNNTYHDIETRTTIRQYLFAMLLVCILSVMLIIAIGLMTFGSNLLYMLLPASFDQSSAFVIVLLVLKWIIVAALLFMAISFTYYFAPARTARFRFISAGSTLATTLVILTTMGFNFYVDHFSRYNAFYGSLGTIIMVLVWIYMNAIALLVGYELNASIRKAGTLQRELPSEELPEEGNSFPPVDRPDQGKAE